MHAFKKHLLNSTGYILSKKICVDIYTYAIENPKFNFTCLLKKINGSMPKRSTNHGSRVRSKHHPKEAQITVLGFDQSIQRGGQSHRLVLF